MTLFSKRCLLPTLALLTFIPLLAGQEPPSRNVRFGLPSAAKADARREVYLIERPQYVLSY
jgi:hypothetical protein